MIDENEYLEFVNGTCSFISSAMTILRQQKEVMVTLNTEMQRHLQILSIQQSIIRDIGKQLLAHKTLLLEHEIRLLDLEKVVYHGDYSKCNIPVKKSN